MQSLRRVETIIRGVKNSMEITHGGKVWMMDKVSDEEITFKFIKVLPPPSDYKWKDSLWSSGNYLKQWRKRAFSKDIKGKLIHDVNGKLVKRARGKVIFGKQKDAAKYFRKSQTLIALIENDKRPLPAAWFEEIRKWNINKFGLPLLSKFNPYPEEVIISKLPSK